MEATALKIDLIDKIEHADPQQLKEIYGLVINYFNGQDTFGEWEELSEYQKEQMTQGLEEADAGLGTSAKEVVQMMREKYGLNG